MRTRLTRLAVVVFSAGTLLILSLSIRPLTAQEASGATEVSGSDASKTAGAWAGPTSGTESAGTGGSGVPQQPQLGEGESGGSCG